MSLLKNKKTSKTDRKKNQSQSMSFEEFKKSFQSLDSNNYGSWPLVVKITLIVAIIAVVALLTYFVPVKKKMQEIEAAEMEKQSLLDTYKEKESKARHLEEYKNQIAQMEVEFNSLLEQLPKETRVSELVKGINMTGVGSNIRFRKITVMPEVQQEFFIEQPIEITATGDYHQFGGFVSGLAALPRIITMHDFKVSSSVKEKLDIKDVDSVGALELVLNTKTYRSKTIDESKNDSQEEGEEE